MFGINNKKQWTLFVTMGLLLGVMGIFGAPAGGTDGGRAPVFGVSVALEQNGSPVTAYDINNGGSLNITITLTNTGDGSTGASVVLGWATNATGSMVPLELDSWTGQAVSNTSATVLGYEWQVPAGFDFLPLHPALTNILWVNVTDGAATTNHTQPLSSVLATASKLEVSVQTSNFDDPSAMILGTHNLVATVNLTAETYGKYLADAVVYFTVNDTAAPYANKTVQTASNGAEISFSIHDELLAVNPSPGEHTVSVTLVAGKVMMSAESDPFTIVAPVVDLAAADVGITPGCATIAKGKMPQTVTVSGTVRNSGNAPSGSVTVRFVDGTNELYCSTVDSVGADNTRMFSFGWEINGTVQPGVHTVVMQIDGLPEEKWGSATLNVVGKANVTINAFTATPATGFENDALVLTAMLSNDGYGDATDLPVQFTEVVQGGAPVALGNVTVTVAKGAVDVPVAFNMTFRSITLDEQTVAFRVLAGASPGQSEKSVGVTIKKRFPSFELGGFEVPSGLRSGDNASFNVTVKNTGTANATSVTVTVYAQGILFPLSVGSSTPFSLAVGEQKRIEVRGKVNADGKVNFSAKAASGSRSSTIYKEATVGPAPEAKVSIVKFEMSPKKKDGQPKDSFQTFTALLTLRNSGELPGTVSVTIMEGLLNIVVTGKNETVAANTTSTFKYAVKIKGAGVKAISVIIIGDIDLGGNITSVSKCELRYASPGFEVVVLVAAMAAAVVVARRRKD